MEDSISLRVLLILTYLCIYLNWDLAPSACVWWFPNVQTFNEIDHKILNISILKLLICIITSLFCRPFEWKYYLKVFRSLHIKYLPTTFCHRLQLRSYTLIRNIVTYCLLNKQGLFYSKVRIRVSVVGDLSKMFEKLKLFWQLANEMRMQTFKS